MNNKTALDVYDSVPSGEWGGYFSVGESVSINVDALVRKLRLTKESLLKKGKYCKIFEAETFKRKKNKIQNLRLLHMNLQT